MSAKPIGVVVVAVVAAALGWLGGTQLGGQPESSEASAQKDGLCPGGASPAYWKAPMNPTYVRAAPGKSPMGMDLVPVCPGEAGGGGGRVRVESALIQSSGVRTAQVERRDLVRKIRTSGRVDYDERGVTHVHTKFQGWIEKLYVDYEGQLVERGEPLLDIYSPELVSTQEELLLAQEYREATGKSTSGEVVQGGEALFDASRRRLALWDIPDSAIDRLLSSGEVRKTLTIYAPNRGVVTHMMVREGMEIAPNSNLYTIADLSKIWVYADVYEYELPWVEVGQRGVVELSYLPGRKFEGVVTYVYPILDAKTRTARARLELENPDLVLKPNMYANVTIDADAREQVLAVPEEAILRSGRRNVAIIALPGGYFEPRDVTLGIDSGDGWLEVTEGLREGEQVVTSGQFLIDSESKLKEAGNKFLRAGAEKFGDQEPSPVEHGPGHDAAGEAAAPAMDHAGHDMQGGMAAPGTLPSGESPHTGHDMPTAAE